MASKTMRGGARKVRRRMSSRSDARSTWVPTLPADLLSVSLGAFMTSLLLLLFLHLVLLGLHLDEQLVERLEARVPELAIAIQPVAHGAQRLRTQIVDALLRARFDGDQP